MRKNKLLLLLVLLMMAATGAMAQVAITTDLADSYDAKVGIPITLSIEANNATGYQWYQVSSSEKETMIVGATSSSYTFTPTEVGEYKFFCMAMGEANLYDLTKVTTVIAALPQTYSVTMAEGTEDAENWTVPAEAAEGSPVTATYNGTKKVKSVKAVKKAPAITDLSTLTADYEAKDGETLTGTLASNVKISIADGATVTLKDVNITNLGDNCDWAGINCPGDATLVLEGTNTACAGRDGSGYNNYPGIWIASGKTLTIQGDGTLTAYSHATNPYGAGIGGGIQIACGNIVINSGNITATGGNGGAGIGGGDHGSCGAITISGGTVTATGGNGGAGIGGGRNNGACGTITITSGVTSVKATKGDGAPNSIGKGNGGQDITVNIEAGTNVIMTPVTVTWNSPNFNSSPYTRDGVTLTAGNAASGNNFYDWGEKTFTNTIGKFTKIEIVCGDYNLDGWAQQNLGEYQPDPEGPMETIYKLTWTGNAESVTIPGKYVYKIQSITFTIQ